MRLLLPLLLVLSAVAAAQEPVRTSFANLTIVSAGDEEFDLSTGVTTLLDGGEISDRSSGITLQANWISYHADEFIDTTGAAVTGPFGTVTAGSVFIDIPAARLSASGELRFAGRDLQVSASSLRYFGEQGVVELSGEVIATTPAFTAERVLYHLESGTLLLFSPYSYDDGLLELSAASAGSQLELRRPVNEAAAGTFAASSTPSPETLALFTGLLE